MEVSEADRLLARGMPITLNGQALRVRFGMESLLYLEAEFGGLDVFWAKLSESGFGRTRIQSIFAGMVAGLLETRPDTQGIEDFKRELLKSLETKDLLKYLEAVVLAFSESIPGFEAGDAPKGKGSRASSRSNASTGTARPASTAANGSSGG